MKAVIFPGQGAQYVGMGKSLHSNFPEVQGIFCKIDNILGFELSKKCFFGPREELKDTFIQQVAILAVSLASFEVFKGENIKIDYFSGLSLGEYSCLYPAGVLTLEDLVILVRERALAIQRASESHLSCMFAVIGLEEETLKTKQNLGFYIANINSPKQIVISLSQNNKAKVKDALIALGAKVVELEVSGGFHSPFMEDAKNRLENVINNINFNDAQIPVVSNFTARSHIYKEDIKSNLINQLTHKVLWKQCVEFMTSQGVDTFFEVGPNHVLKGILRKINARLKVINIEKKEDLDALPMVKSL